MRLYFEDLTPGRSFDLGSVAIDEAEMLEFARRFDPQWYHVDRERAAASTWGGLIASGWFTASLSMRIYVDEVLSQAAADTSPGLEELRWLAAVRAGDTLRGVLTVVDVLDSSRGPDLGTAVLRWEMIRDDPIPDQVVLRMQGRGWFHRRPR
ncbi:MAG: MaoC family dehydratase N-terminal domain-containing protein [Geodermatophilaceae bacterium]|nr:MaoC family dehydratase N-terminal domain-containing protein [Geodermatophilaceae bacterium]